MSILDRRFQQTQVYTSLEGIKPKQKTDQTATASIVKKTLKHREEDHLYIKPTHMKYLLENVLIRPGFVLEKLKKATTNQISECGCVPQFDRKSKMCIRKNIETTLTDHICDTHPDKSIPVKIMSVGAGGCYQELAMTKKLNDLGYNVKWTLIDPGFFERPGAHASSHNTLGFFNKLISELNPKNSATAFPNLDITQKNPSNKEYDAILMIDLDSSNTFEYEKLEDGEKGVRKKILSNAKQKGDKESFIKKDTLLLGVSKVNIPGSPALKAQITKEVYQDGEVVQRKVSLY
jgi:hypothetical protein